MATARRVVRTKDDVRPHDADGAGGLVRRGADRPRAAEASRAGVERRRRPRSSGGRRTAPRRSRRGATRADRDRPNRHGAPRRALCAACAAHPHVTAGRTASFTFDGDKPGWFARLPDGAQRLLARLRQGARLCRRRLLVDERLRPRRQERADRLGDRRPGRRTTGALVDKVRALQHRELHALRRGRRYRQAEVEALPR